MNEALSPDSAAPLPQGLFADDAACPRCAWCKASPLYRHYHDHEWGFPVADDRRLFEKICLEGFQFFAPLGDELVFVLGFGGLRGGGLVHGGGG